MTKMERCLANANVIRKMYLDGVQYREMGALLGVSGSYMIQYILPEFFDRGILTEKDRALHNSKSHDIGINRRKNTFRDKRISADDAVKEILAKVCNINELTARFILDTNRDSLPLCCELLDELGSKVNKSLFTACVKKEARKNKDAGYIHLAKHVCGINSIEECEKFLGGWDISEERKRGFRRALEALSERRQFIIQKVYFDWQSMQAVADELGVSRAFVWSELREAFKQLRRVPYITLIKYGDTVNVENKEFETPRMKNKRKKEQMKQEGPLFLRGKVGGRIYNALTRAGYKSPMDFASESQLRFTPGLGEVGLIELLDALDKEGVHVIRGGSEVTPEQVDRLAHTLRGHGILKLRAYGRELNLESSIDVLRGMVSDRFLMELRLSGYRRILDIKSIEGIMKNEYFNGQRAAELVSILRAGGIRIKVHEEESVA